MYSKNKFGIALLLNKNRRKYIVKLGQILNIALFLNKGTADNIH